MNITLKNVPESVYRAMKREAKQQGRSLNAQIIGVLESAVAELERQRRLPLEDGAPLIRQDRR